MSRAKAKATPITSQSRARDQPGLRKRPARAVGGPAGWCSGARTVAAIRCESSLARALDQVLDQCVDLGPRKRSAVVGGHDVVLVALRDHLGGVGDRRLDEGRVLALE